MSVTTPPSSSPTAPHTPLPAPKPITEHNWPAVTRSVVSVWCTTYNHASFLPDALKGILYQETTFPVEVIVHDDASTDETTEVVKEYQQRFPSLVKSIIQSENQYSQGRRAREFLLPQTSGRYIARCEGDDYWTDPRKLQIQVEFLESHPEYVISGHDAFIVNESREKMKGSKLPLSMQRDFSGEELVLGKAWILTMSMVFRNVIKEWPPEMSTVRNGDHFLTSLLGHFGAGKFHANIQPAAYRVHKGGVWSAASRHDRLESQLHTFYEMHRYYKRIGHDEAARHYRTLAFNRLLRTTPTDQLLQTLRKRWFPLGRAKRAIMSLIRPPQRSAGSPKSSRHPHKPKTSLELPP